MFALSASTMRSAATSIVATLSPTKNSCRVRVPAQQGCAAAVSWFRYDPYACRVLASPAKGVQSPAHVGITDSNRHAAVAAAMPHSPPSSAVAVPRANRSLLDILKVKPSAKPVAPIAVAPTATKEAAPAAAVSEPATVKYAFVKLKHDTLTYTAPFRVATGDLVVVEGDRGEDLGTVMDISAEKPNYAVPCRIVRKATARDREQLLAKRAKEDSAVRSCQSLADSLGLSLQIIDTEFQFDYNKLTVYFRSRSRHTDFRKLQRGLFREFRCRIWLTEAFRHIDTEANH